MADKEKITLTWVGEAYIDFARSIRALSNDLAEAYSLFNEIYSQTASISRFENSRSINRVNEFLSYIDYDPQKAEGIIRDFLKIHKPSKYYSGKDPSCKIGIKISFEYLLNPGPDSREKGTSQIIATLIHRAARLRA
jgi:hypothetical protein